MAEFFNRRSPNKLSPDTRRPHAPLRKVPKRAVFRHSQKCFLGNFVTNTTFYPLFDTPNVVTENYFAPSLFDSYHKYQ